MKNFEKIGFFGQLTKIGEFGKFSKLGLVNRPC